MMLDTLPTISTQQLPELPMADTLVITVNNRMAIQLKQTLVTAHRDQARVFQIADVQPWNRFVDFVTERLIFALGEMPAATQLTPLAALLNWEAVLDEEDTITLNRTKLARLLADAHSLQLEWGVEVEASEETPEYDEYQKIRDKYLARLEQRDATDGPLKNRWVLERLQALAAADKVGEGARISLSKSLAKTIVLQGFRELSAIQRGILQACQDLGATIVILDDEQTVASQPRVLSAQNRSEELAAAVEWAQQMLTQHRKGRFAIIDPLLQNEVNTVRRYLHEKLQEAGLKRELLYNVSIGRPLSEWSIVRSVLAWLKLLITLIKQDRINTDDLGQSLLLGQEALLSKWADALSARDHKLRKDSRVSYKKAEVHQFFHEVSEEFGALNEQAIELLSSESVLSLNQWLAKFRAFFELFTFPGIPMLSSAQYQVCEAFEAALNTTAALSPALDPMDAKRALQLLERVCQQQIFQPQRAATARLDVLGMLEAEGAQWDAVWIMSLQDDVLPTIPKPNPMLPKSALLRVNAPRTDHDREFQWAEAMLKSLLLTAPEVTISWHSFVGEMVAEASPLIEAYVAKQDWELITPPTQSAAMHDVGLERLRDDHGPGLSLNDRLRGGSRLFDLQSKNPLWAFAAYRLHMEEFKPYPRYELDRMQRGNFIHSALEYFWKDVRDQATLKDLVAQGQLEQKVAEAVEASAKEELLFESQVLLALEKDFAKNQLLHFLKEEEGRELAFDVLEVEKKVELRVGQISVNVKVDRIDQLENGGYLYLDYKTGNLPNYKQSWYRERPIDLQLPLYATHAQGEVAQDVVGVGFAGLKPNSMGFNGIGSVNWIVDGYRKIEVKEEAALQGQLGRWRKQLEGLADEIYQGYAANRYEDIKDMEYCEVLPFLRLTQSTEEAGDE